MQLGQKYWVCGHQPIYLGLSLRATAFPTVGWHICNRAVALLIRPRAQFHSSECGLMTAGQA